jgi:hypothetical protein
VGIGMETRACRRWREDKGARDKKNRGEEGIEFSKDLYVITENSKGLSLKQNFPLI